MSDIKAGTGLWPLIQEAGSGCLTVLGTVKNAGKTEVLMRIVSEAEAAGVRLGLTSIGRDGEDKDAVFGHAKPPIVVPRGSLVLTYLNFAGKALPSLQVVDIMQAHHFQYGDLAVVEAREKVQLQVAGPSRKSEITAGVKRLRALGAQQVLVDGAMDRRGAIDPQAVPDLIMATGMALSPRLEEVVASTAYSVELLKLPVWEGKIPAATSYFSAGKWHDIVEERVMGGEEAFAASLPDGVQTIYLQGALTDRLLQALKKYKQCPILVVDSAFSVFANRALFHSYVTRNAPVYVRQRFNLLAVTVNPWSMYKAVDPAVLARAVKDKIPEVRVIDVVAGIYL